MSHYFIEILARDKAIVIASGGKVNRPLRGDGSLKHHLLQMTGLEPF